MKTIEIRPGMEIPGGVKSESPPVFGHENLREDLARRATQPLRMSDQFNQAVAASAAKHRSRQSGKSALPLLLAIVILAPIFTWTGCKAVHVVRGTVGAYVKALTNAMADAGQD